MAILSRTLISAMGLTLAGLAGSSPLDAADGFPLRQALAPLREWQTPVREPMEEALERYEDGQPAEALDLVEQVLGSPDVGSTGDDALFLRGLAAFDLGNDALATTALRGVLESDPVSAHYPSALLYLIETEYRAGRYDDAAEDWGRYFDQPWSGRDRHGREVQRSLLAAGVRWPGRWLRSAELDRLADPAALRRAILATRGGDRFDRAVYLAGMALYRIDRDSDTVAALERISLTSAYFPYALFTAAQAFYRLGRDERAIEVLHWLERYPRTTAAGDPLAVRGDALLARSLIRAGRRTEARKMLRSLVGRGPRARSFAARISLELGEASLAILFIDSRSPSSFPTEVETALVMAAAHEDLGDLEGAIAAFESASALAREARKRLENTLVASRTLLARQAEAHTRAQECEDSRRRRRLASSLRAAIDAKRLPFVKRMVRRMRNALLSPSNRTAILADPDPAPLDGLWLTYLRSPHRSDIEAELRANRSHGRQQLPGEIAEVVDERRATLRLISLEAETAAAKLRNRQPQRLALSRTLLDRYASR